MEAPAGIEPTGFKWVHLCPTESNCSQLFTGGSISHHDVQEDYMQLNEGTLIRLLTEDFCTAQKSLDHYYETPGSFREFMEATITGRAGQWVVPLDSAEVDADGQLTWEKITRQAASIVNLNTSPSARTGSMKR